ncbi:uncharacterized protein [Fopius arisanus]|uniref:CCHC-type domain-containing protein n=1 Tax=Fopius arisanus TaxID=64838 RepID=A0A9R1U9H8_9HYME|nr:PREDICTED: uncharacterized protein LOC105272746 [Fopius arisanus]
MDMDFIKPASFTVQGRDTPVQASESAKAGSLASSSSDCSMLEVARSASIMSRTTSEVCKGRMNTAGVPPAGLTEVPAVANTQWKDAFSKLESLIYGLHDLIQPKTNVHREIKTKVTSICSAMRRLKELEVTQARQASIPVAVAGKDGGCTPQAAQRSRKDSETTVKDTDAEDDRESRKGLRRKRSKDSPGTINQVPKKCKQYTPARQADLPKQTGEKPPAQPDWVVVKGRRKPTGLRREDGAGKVKRKKQDGPRRRPQVRPDALIVRPVSKEQYCDILRRVKKEVPQDQAACVQSIRRTTTGDMLLTLRKATDGAPQLRKTIADLLGDDAEVVSKGPQEELEIKDLDEITTKEEVLEALQAAAGEEFSIDIGAVKAVRKGFRGTQTAVVSLAAKVARKVVGDTSKIKIGWVNCRIVRVERPPKCYRCWHFGHMAIHCKSKVDRSRLCTKCAEPGHKASECKATPKCAICADNDSKADLEHIAGGGRCPEFRAALQKKTCNGRK